MNETKLIQIGDWVVRVRLPEGKGPHPVLLLLHGLTGDENVMWVFTSRLPRHYLMLAPRAPNPFSGGGYSWYQGEGWGLPDIDTLREPVKSLLDLIESLKSGVFQNDKDGGIDEVNRKLEEANFTQVNVVGFSQGAAITYTLALLYPERVNLIAGLAGFVPTGAADIVEKKPLDGKQVYVTHGKKDDMVPVERAHQAVELLRKAGADVTYCEEDVGHKLSAACFRTLGDFFDRYGQRQ
jgi:phospholipase/carboxylesterase